MNAESPKSKPKLIKILLLVALIVLVPVAPFAIVGEHSERWIADNLLTGSYVSGGSALGLLSIIAVLASDILLPVPSSGVMTFTGAALGWWVGSAVCFVGLMLSCAIGYALGVISGCHW